MLTSLQALSLDLDDTLWPIRPTLRRAEERLHEWLAVRAPATAALHDVDALMVLRQSLQPGFAHWGEGLAQARRATIREALRRAGDDESLAEEGFQVYLAARQDVQGYPEVEQRLADWSGRFRLVAITNGNADLSRIPMGRFFSAHVAAADVGAPKPEPVVFEAALRRLGLAPSQVLHIGDDWHMDVMGARRAGMPAVWLAREAQGLHEAPTADRHGIWHSRCLDEVDALLPR